MNRALIYFWKKKLCIKEFLLASICFFLIHPSIAFGLCAAQDMEGLWMHETYEGHRSSFFHSIGIHFPCYDTYPSSDGPTAFVRILQCGDDYHSPYNCDLGPIPALHAFLSVKHHTPQFTRVDARFVLPAPLAVSTVGIVALRIDKNRILVYKGDNYLDVSEDNDYFSGRSEVGFFARVKCYEVMGRRICREPFLRPQNSYPLILDLPHPSIQLKLQPGL